MNSFFINFRLRRPRAAFLDIVCSVVQWAESGKMVQMFVRTSCYFLHDINYLPIIATSLNFHFFWLLAFSAICLHCWAQQDPSTEHISLFKTQWLRCVCI